MVQGDGVFQTIDENGVTEEVPGDRFVRGLELHEVDGEADLL
jgi:hypothetical protein